MMIIVPIDTSELRMELKRSAEDIRQLEARKEATKIKITGLEVQIKRLKESGEVPYLEIWRLENELAELTRERNALADGLWGAWVREQTRMQSLKRIEQENRKALEMKRPRMRAREWKRPRGRALGWKRPRMRVLKRKRPGMMRKR
jgi:chromosome segregation ATPase